MSMNIFKYWLPKTNIDFKQSYKHGLRALSSGFTLIEIVLVVVIMAIVAGLAIPMMTSATSSQISSAANIIAADLEYAKSMAIGRQKVYYVVFDESSESYHLEDTNGTIDHPVKKGFKYIMDFSSDSRVGEVEIASADFGGSNTVAFDYLGSPDNGGTIVLQAGDRSMTITVAPVTGYITISN